VTRVAIRLARDHHTHVTLYAALAACPTLAGLDQAGALARLAALPRDRVSTVVGWQSATQPLGPGDLARLPPAIVVNASLHGLLLTAAAEEALRATDPELAARHREADWAERNLDRLLATYARAAGLDAAALDAFMAGLAALGIGEAEDLLVTGPEAWAVLRRSPWAGRVRCWAGLEGCAALPAEARGALAGVKLFTDGAFGARTAAVSEPYRGGGTGLLLQDDEALGEALARAARATEAGAVAIHALGDVAVEQALRVVEPLRRGGPLSGPVRLEHAQLIGEAQARRARDLGLVLSMQPNFSEDSVLYADRLGPGAVAGNNPFRMLVDRCGFRPGVDLLLGSDGMPHGLEAAAQWALFPSQPGQRLTLEELLAGYGTAPDAAGPVALLVDEAARRVRLVPADRPDQAW
jgi:predicted amidohydrolase YtcJ